MYYSNCVVRSVCKHTFLILVVSAVVNIKTCWSVCLASPFVVSMRTGGSVAAGVAVPSLFLDDDSLVVAGIVR